MAAKDTTLHLLNTCWSQVVHALSKLSQDQRYTQEAASGISSSV